MLAAGGGGRGGRGYANALCAVYLQILPSGFVPNPMYVNRTLVLLVTFSFFNVRYVLEGLRKYAVYISPVVLLPGVC